LLAFRDAWFPELQAERKIEKSKDNEISVLIGLMAFIEIPPNFKLKVETTCCLDIERRLLEKLATKKPP
jgi:hypothetical protein